MIDQPSIIDDPLSYIDHPSSIIDDSLAYIDNPSSIIDNPLAYIDNPSSVEIEINYITEDTYVDK